MIGGTIGLRLTARVMLTALLVITVFAIFSIRSESQSLLQEVERHASQLSNRVESDLGYDMLHNDYQRIHAGITRVGQQESIDRVRMFNKAGEIIYSSDASDIGKMVDTRAESCYRCHSAGEPLAQLDMRERTRIFRPEPRTKSSRARVKSWSSTSRAPSSLSSDRTSWSRPSSTRARR